MSFVSNLETTKTQIKTPAHRKDETGVKAKMRTRVLPRRNGDQVGASLPEAAAIAMEAKSAHSPHPFPSKDMMPTLPVGLLTHRFMRCPPSQASRLSGMVDIVGDYSGGAVL
jgi:hypothetical protein